MRRRRLMGVYRGFVKSMDAVAPITVARSAAAEVGGTTQHCGPSATQKLAEGAAEYNRHRPARPALQRPSSSVNTVALTGHPRYARRHVICGVPSTSRRRHDRIRQARRGLRAALRARRGTEIQGHRAAQQAFGAVGGGKARADRRRSRQLRTLGRHDRSRGRRRSRRGAQDPQGFRRQRRQSVRSSDRPHHDRIDGQGRRRHPSRKVAHIMAIPTFSLAKKLHAGETVYSGWCGLPYPLVAETLARDGFAAVAIESQHGLWDVGGILNGIAAVRQGGGAPIVRVPLNDFALVSRALDFGAEGIIAPMINTAADAKAFAAAAKFPPIGERSWGPHRAMTLGGVSDMGTYLREANENIITLAMIETRTSLQNFEAIITTPGIDGFFLGPSDLSIALSDGKTVDPLSKEVDGHLDKMIAGAQKAKKIPGAYCHSAERAAALAKRGVRFLAVSSDLSMLRAGAAAALKVLKG